MSGGKSVDASDARLAAMLITQLGSPDPQKRENVAWALGDMTLPTQIVSALIRALKDPSESVRWRIARALGKMGENALPAVPALVKALEDNVTVRRSAAWTLKEIGEKAVEALPALLKALEDPDDVVQGGAAEALANFGERSLHAVLGAVARKELTHEQARTAVEKIREKLQQNGLRTGVQKAPVTPPERKMHPRLAA